jgi:dipeptidyl aminopeptidase/acylaminoacyl peptidase
MLCTEGPNGQCINCHNYQQYNPERMLFHARQNLGGTIVAYDGKIRKINMKNDSILSAGVYPTWHPELPLVVFSTNLTHQAFHVSSPNKIEVYDTSSDLIAYDVTRNEVTNIENDPDELEVFPYWAPDGKSVYYSSAHFEYPDSTTNHVYEYVKRYNKVRYNIYRKSFDPATMTFGSRELVFAADSLGKSATLPRISPDGRFLLFTMATYGVFHIWHHDADLWMIDLQTLKARPARELNSKDTESYHSWSSNGRWVVFSSRRDDGDYTRPFIAHIDENGKGTKPFELPCADPDYHRQFVKCYNIPEFMKGPVTVRPQTFADVLKRDGELVKYVQRLAH